MFVVESRGSLVKIEDLGISVSPGAPAWISKEQKSKSNCLRQLEKLGKIRVSTGNLSRSVKTPLAEKPPAKKKTVLASPPGKIVEGRASAKDKSSAPVPPQVPKILPVPPVKESESTDKPKKKTKEAGS